MAASSIQQAVALAFAYGRLLAKYKWPCLIATLALTLVLTVIVAQLPNVYEATTTILVDPQQVSEKYVSAAISSEPYIRLNTVTQQLLSRSRLQEIIEKYNLYSARRGAHTPEELVEKMRDDITIEVKQGSAADLSTFSLTYRGTQPILVAEVANELAATFIKWNITSRTEQVSGTKDFLSWELMATKRNLEQQENNLRQFKMSHLGETPDQTAGNLQALVGLRAALSANADAMNRLDEEKILLTRSPEAIPVASSPPASLTQRERLELENRQLEATIEQLREHYSDRYPDLVRANRRVLEIKAQLNSLPADPPDHSSEGSGEKSLVTVRLELVDKEMKKLEAERDRIQSQIESYQGKVDAAPIREQEQVELTRNYETSKQHYQILLDKSFNAAMAADLEQNQKAVRFRVLDPARVPQKPVKPRRKILIPAAGFMALGLSILCAIVKEELSPSVKTEIELKSLLPAGVQVWGFIPRIAVASEARRERRMSIFASIVCILLCLTLIEVIRGIHPL